jgi:hypothetical protein
MSPGRFDGRYCTKREDIWSLGVTFYWMLTGNWPFKTVTEILTGTPEPLPETIPGATRHLIDVMLEKDEAKRPTAKQVEVACLMMGDVEGSKPILIWRNPFVFAGAETIVRTLRDTYNRRLCLITCEDDDEMEEVFLMVKVEMLDRVRVVVSESRQEVGGLVCSPGCELIARWRSAGLQKEALVLRDEKGGASGSVMVGSDLAAVEDFIVECVLG